MWNLSNTQGFSTSAEPARSLNPSTSETQWETVQPSACLLGFTAWLNWQARERYLYEPNVCVPPQASQFVWRRTGPHKKALPSQKYHIYINLTYLLFLLYTQGSNHIFISTFDVNSKQQNSHLISALCEERLPLLSAPFMYLYLIVLIRTSLGFLWSFISVKYTRFLCFGAKLPWKMIAGRQGICHPCSLHTASAWRSKGAFAHVAVFVSIWTRALVFGSVLQPASVSLLSEWLSVRTSLSLTDYSKSSCLAFWLKSWDVFPLTGALLLVLNA